MDRIYKKGVYRASHVLGDAKIDVLIFDGEYWWIPGWECPMEISDHFGSFNITEDNIKDLLWEWVS
jgi:predicted ATP-dependent Lon-type protease